MQFKLSIVIPCYNEEKNIPLVFDRFQAAIGNRDDIQVVMVNNGSLDDSAGVFESLLPKYPFAKLVTVVKNQGYGFGILSGLQKADGEFIGWTHADLQTDPKDVIKAYEIIKAMGGAKNLYVKGSRRGRPLFDQFFTMGMGVFESIYLWAPLREINAQPNIFHRSFFESWVNPPNDFALDLYVLYMAHKQHLRVVRFPVVFPPRIHGESSRNTSFKAKWKFIKRTLSFSTELKKSLKKA